MKNELIEKAIAISGSQKKLAETIGVSQAAIHKLLTRKNNGMRLTTLMGLSKVTGISVEEIIKNQMTCELLSNDQNNNMKKS